MYYTRLHLCVAGNTLERDMQTFLQDVSSEFCDVTLLLDDVQIAAHKSVLAARCSYFEAMFRSFMPDDGCVKASNCFAYYLVWSGLTSARMFSCLKRFHLVNHRPSQADLGSDSEMVVYVCGMRHE